MVQAIKICKQIKAKGYVTFVQPMVTLTYSDDEIEQLVDLVNDFLRNLFIWWILLVQ